MCVCLCLFFLFLLCFFFFQAEDGIRDLVRSRGLGDVYKRQFHGTYWHSNFGYPMSHGCINMITEDAKWLYDWAPIGTEVEVCLLYTSDAADERSSVDLGGRRIIKKKNIQANVDVLTIIQHTTKHRNNELKKNTSRTNT